MKVEKVASRRCFPCDGRHIVLVTRVRPFSRVSTSTTRILLSSCHTRGRQESQKTRHGPRTPVRTRLRPEEYSSLSPMTSAAVQCGGHVRYPPAGTAGPSEICLSDISDISPFRHIVRCAIRLFAISAARHRMHDSLLAASAWP